MSKTKISIRASQYVVSAADDVAEENDHLSRSDVLRRWWRIAMQTDDGMDVPEYAEKQATHAELVERNKPAMRTMHFRQRIHEYLHDTLTDQHGYIAAFPPKPEVVRESYGESIREEIRKEHPDHADRFEDHLDDRLDWYELMHPETDGGDPRTEAVQLAAFHLLGDREDHARNAVRSAAPMTDATEHELLDEARRVANRGDWRHVWDDQTRARQLSDFAETDS